MAEQDWETIKRAVEVLNAGDTKTALDLCTDGVVLHLGRFGSRPFEICHHGRDSIRELWHETVESVGEPFELKPVRLLSDGRHLVLFVDAIFGTGPAGRTQRAVVTGTAGPDDLWSEFWVELDQPLP